MPLTPKAALMSNSANGDASKDVPLLNLRVVFHVGLNFFFLP